MNAHVKYKSLASFGDKAIYIYQKVGSHYSEKKVSLGLQILLNMKALSTLIQNLKLF